MDTYLKTPTIQYNNDKGEKYNRNCCFNPYPLQLCYNVQNKTPIPLKRVHFNLNIMKGLSCVEIKQSYSTIDNDSPIDLEYIFVIDKNAAVTKMIVELGDNKVYGIVKEKEEAKQEYEEGINQGKTMAYSEQNQYYPEIKKLKLGQLAPQKELKITFEYIQPLEVCFNRFWKVNVNPLVDQQYFSQPKGNYQINLFNYFDTFVYINKGENIPYDYTIHIDAGSKITFVKSPTHELNATNVKTTGSKMDYGLLNQDQKQFTLLFSTEDINVPSAILSHTNNDALQQQKYCATITFIPKFNEIPLDDAYQQYLDNNLGQNIKINRGNYLFIIDRSGSMAGTRIEKAKEALILFLKSLPENSQFNIISFGSESSQLWYQSKQYNQKSLNEAVQFVKTIAADMGGTEILNALKTFVYSKEYGLDQDATLNVFLLTDGQVDAKPVLDLVKNNNRAETRIYSLGIGVGCDQYLIKTIAEVGNGKHQFVIEDEDINEKVIDLLEDSITPYLKQFNINCNAQNIQQIIPNPESILSLKKNEQITIQVLFSGQQQQDNVYLDIDCSDPQNQKQIKYQVNLNINESQENEYFHKLAAHKLIKYYETAQNNQENICNKVKMNKISLNDQDIINISIENQILCSKTAFICEVCDVEDQFKQQKRENIQVSAMGVYQPILSQSPIHILDPKIPGAFQILRCSFDLGLAQPARRKSSFSAANLVSRQSDYQSPQNYVQQPKTATSSSCQRFCIKIQNLFKSATSLFQKKDNQDETETMLISKKEFDYEQNVDNDTQANIQEQISMSKLTYQEIILFLQADGSFSFSKDIRQQLDFNHEQNFSELIWDTILGLLYLEFRCKENQRAWQLVYQKAVQYLQNNGIDFKKVKMDYQQEYEK